MAVVSPSSDKIQNQDLVSSILSYGRVMRGGSLKEQSPKSEFFGLRKLEWSYPTSASTVGTVSC